MRIVPFAPFPAKQPPALHRAQRASPTAIICAALLLALGFLALQIASNLRTTLFSDCSSIGSSVKGSCPL
jgi:hypothetical protein